MIINIHKIRNPHTGEDYYKYLCRREGDNQWVEVSIEFCSTCLNIPNCPISKDEFRNYLESNPTCKNCGNNILSEGYLYITHQLERAGLFTGDLLCCRCYSEKSNE